MWFVADPNQEARGRSDYFEFKGNLLLTDADAKTAEANNSGGLDGFNALSYHIAGWHCRVALGRERDAPDQQHKQFAAWISRKRIHGRRG